jgi:hypothetical protein
MVVSPKGPPERKTERRKRPGRLQERGGDTNIDYYVNGHRKCEHVGPDKQLKED